MSSGKTRGAIGHGDVNEVVRDLPDGTEIICWITHRRTSVTVYLVLFKENANVWTSNRKNKS